MPIIKCHNPIEVYRNKASARDLNELSGRTGRADLTRFVCEQILRKLQLEEDDVLVDVGCGDGTLLKLAGQNLRTGFGILPTSEETERVRAELESMFPKIQVRQGLVQRTDLETALANKIVCNGVIVLLAENEVDAALREIVRLSQPGALVFIGEVPTRSEFDGRTYGDSVIRWLWWVLRKQGVKAFLFRFRQVLRAIFSGELFIIAPKTHFHETGEKFIARAERAGLVLEASYPHPERTETNEIGVSSTRLDYLFRAPSAAEARGGRAPSSGARRPR